ncbi:DUF308 domain-containing protein [Pendulispora brunnea]|uniref:DUF308 domain-containing protein n=1 Tax=Pendulispora brunnea TaxID=2905690 RepID=A0ABZ2K3N5_9BACT
MVALLRCDRLTLGALVMLFGVYALVDGSLAFAAAPQRRATEGEGRIEGFLGMAFGLFTIWAELSLSMFVHVVAVWAILTGVLELAAIVRLRGRSPGELSLGFAALGAIPLGVTLLVWPSEMAPLAIVALLGCYALLFGGSMLVLAFQLRKLTMHFHSRMASRGDPAIDEVAARARRARGDRCAPLAVAPKTS